MLLTENWGEVDYAAAVEKQLLVVDEVAAQSPERLIFCTHPPLVSTGRGTKPGDVFGWNGPVLETSRGGRATYHGPSQIVVYPIIDLNTARVGFRARDIHGYMHAIERAIVETLGEIGITAQAGSDLEREGELEMSEAETVKIEAETVASIAEPPSLTGVWVSGRKIASVGIGVRKGISYHGLALNVENDPKAFQGINPCGFTTDKMTSVERELQKIGEQETGPMERGHLGQILAKNLIRQFSVL